MKKILLLIIVPLLLSCSEDDGGTTPIGGYQINVSQPQLVVHNGYHPKWSPIGNFIAYTTSVGGTWKSGCWILTQITLAARFQVFMAI